MAFAQPYRDEPFGTDLAGSVYAFDASTIDLYLSLFPWAHFGRTKSAKASIKLHTLLDLRGNTPSFIHLSNCQHRRMANVCGLDTLSLEAGAIYVMNRGYLDFTRLYRFHGLHGLHEASAFFVTRPQHTTQLRRSSSMPSSPATRAAHAAAGIRSDQRISLTGKHTCDYYPETGKALVLLTNNFKLPAVTIAARYKVRWQVELLFNPVLSLSKDGFSSICASRSSTAPPRTR